MPAFEPYDVISDWIVGATSDEPPPWMSGPAAMAAVAPKPDTTSARTWQILRLLDFMRIPLNEDEIKVLCFAVAAARRE
ncbi:hypothetical protein BGC_40940 [Burkholderia sp. 3C]